MTMLLDGLVFFFVVDFDSFVVVVVLLVVRVHFKVECTRVTMTSRAQVKLR